jgi:hypothetical protein
MCVPFRLLYGGDAVALGGVREDFFVETARMAGLRPDYLKSTRGEKTPDYLLHTPSGKLVVEIGGKGKGRGQFKNVAYDRKIILADGDRLDEIRRPLFCWGFLEKQTTTGG